MHRRSFLRSIPALAATLGATSAIGAHQGGSGGSRRQVMTVLGPIDPRDLGFTLSHEHALVSFQPYGDLVRSPLAYDRDEAAEVVLPHLARARALGCRAFVDATPQFLGRDATLLRRLSEKSGLHVIAPTGNYAARNHQHLPPHVFTEAPSAVAQRWVDEWKNGIDGTGVRPGFVKLGFNGGRLSDAEQRLIRAAAIAHRETGLVIASHTGPAVSAFEQLSELEAAGVHPSAWIWVHAQAEKDLSRQVQAARRGAWISFDGVARDTISVHLDGILRLRDAGLLDRVLVSHDAGWYHVGEARGGEFRPYDTVFTAFVPALRAKGFTQAEIDTVFVGNPAKAFTVGVRHAEASRQR